MTHGAAWGVLVLRVMLGVVFVMHGYAGFAVFGPKGVEAVISRMGYPAAAVPVLVWYGLVVHAVGGALIILGLWTRLAALLNVPIMASAVAFLHWQQGFFLKGALEPASGRPTVAGYEYALLVLACTVAIVLIGAGPFSLDSLRPRPNRRR